MTYPVELPALDGRDPLGFLASLGLVNMLTDFVAEPPPRLAFSSLTGNAVIHGPWQEIDDVAAAARRIVDAIPEGAVIPGAAPGLPLPSASGPDPMRVRPGDYREMVEGLRRTDPATAGTWLPSLVTDLALDTDGRCDISPYLAPSGQQKIRTFFEKPLAAVRASPTALREALTGWRRTAGFSGEYLDHRVLRSSADDVTGTGREMGVPGATWLATMSLPLLRVTGNGTRTRATLWHHIGRRDVMIWPIWRDPLDIDALRSLLEHPAFTPSDNVPTVSRETWPPLSVITVCGAQRQQIPRRKFRGVLTPMPVATLPGKDSHPVALNNQQNIDTAKL